MTSPELGPALHPRRAVGVRDVLDACGWVACGLTLIAALWLRFIELDHLPGINGDEAVYAVHARSLLDGAPLSSLRTGTGLPMNPPFFGLVVLVQWLLPPSMFALRLPALVHSLLAPALALLLFRRRGWTFAGVFAAAIFVLPIHIGYARFAWDASAVPTVMVLALAAATAQRGWLTALAFALCLWVHPVTVFALPVLAAPFLATWWTRSERTRSRNLRVLAASALCVSLAGGALLYYDLVPDVVSAAVRSDLPHKVLARLVSPADALYYLRLFADLLLGPTLYRYISGSLPDAMGALHLALGITLIAALSVSAVPRLVRARGWNDLALIGGLVLSLLASYAFGGLRVLSPNTERYGMFLTVPACYLFAAFVHTLASDLRAAPWLRAVLTGAAALLLLSFHAFYVQALHRPDPQRKDAFRTGDVDPKSAAWDALQAMREPSRAAIVMTQDWWIYWPVRYRAHGQAGVRITIPGMPKDLRFPADYAALRWPPPVRDAQLFGIAWANGAFDRALAPLSMRRVELYGYEPGPILRVHLLRRSGGAARAPR